MNDCEQLFEHLQTLAFSLAQRGCAVAFVDAAAVDVVAEACCSSPQVARMGGHSDAYRLLTTYAPSRVNGCSLALLFTAHVLLYFCSPSIFFFVHKRTYRAVSL